MKSILFKTVSLIFVGSVLLLGTLSLQAVEERDPNAYCESDQVKVKVKGVVCSFCAYGVERNLSKLSFLDQTHFGNDGVLIDISTQFITLAIEPGKRFNFEQIYDAINRGGYDPFLAYMRLSGKIKKQGQRYFLTHSQTGEVFELTGPETKNLSEGSTFTIQASLLEESDITQVVVHEVQETQ